MPDPAMMVLASGGHGHGHGRLLIAVAAVLVIAVIVVAWLHYSKVRASRASDSRGEQQ